MLLLCSCSAPPLAEFPPPQAANNSREQSPMRRPITSPTRRDGLPTSEWSMPLLLLSSLISVADMLTLGVPLSREVGEGLPKVREFWWELSLGPYRGMGAELHAHVLYRQGAWRGVFRGTGVRLCRMLDINFREFYKGELRRIPIPRTWVHKGKSKLGLLLAPACRRIVDRKP